MKYRKTALVDAVQWWKHGDHPNVVPVPYGHPVDTHAIQPNTWGWIQTLEGGLLVEPGTWILTGPRGESWPVRDDIFRETYEAVSEAPVTPPAAPAWQNLQRRLHEADEIIEAWRTLLPSEKVAFGGRLATAISALEYLTVAAREAAPDGK